MAKLRTLSDSDLALLRRIIAREQKRLGNPQSRPESRPGWDVDQHQSPDVYVAKVPSGGLPAMAGEVPGFAECDIYQIILDGETPSLIPVEIFKQVYNPFTVAVAADTWITVLRDKFGEWLPIHVVSTSGIDTDELAKVSSDDTTAGYLEAKIVPGVGLRARVLNDGSDESLELYLADTGTGTEVDDDERVKVSSDDTTASYLDAKLVAGPGLRSRTLNDGGDEQFEIYLGTGTDADDDERVKVSANDTTAGYLNGKLVAGTNIALTELNDGSDETLQVSWIPDTGTGTDTDAGITVEEVDGSPSITGVRTVQFNQDDGFSISNPAPGVARVGKPSSGCAAFTTYAFRYRCEANNLNEYSLANVFTFGASGCVSVAQGPEIFVRTVACCDDSCGGYPGTASGTFGTGTTSPPCCAVGPNICVELTNLNGAPLLNGLEIQLSYDFTVGYWRGWSEPILGCPPAVPPDLYFTIGFSVDCDPDTGIWKYNWRAMMTDGSKPALSLIPPPEKGKVLDVTCDPFAADVRDNFGPVCYPSNLEVAATDIRATFTEGVCDDVIGTGTDSDVTVACCSNAIPATLTATPTLDTNVDCPTSSFTLTYNAGTGRWEGTYSGSAIEVWCDGSTLSDWRLTGCGATSQPINALSSSCDPISLVFDSLTPTCCSATFLTLTITE